MAAGLIHLTEENIISVIRGCLANKVCNFVAGCGRLIGAVVGGVVAAAAGDQED